MAWERRFAVSIMIGIAIIGCFLVAGLILRSAVETPDMNTALLVNGEKVSLEEVRRAYTTLPGVYFSEEEALKAAVNSVINYKLILQDAKSRGIYATDEEVEDLIQGLANASGMSRNEFEKRIEGSGLNIDEFRERLREEIVVRKTLQSVLEETAAGDNTREELMPDYVMVRQIFLSADDYGKEELVKEANNVSNRLTQEEFCKVAEDYNQSCDEYIITRESVFREYADAAFGQPEGNITIVASKRGVHFVQTLMKILDENSVKAQAARNTEAYREYIERLRSEAEIENFLQK